MSAYRTEDVTSVIEEMAEAVDERLWDRVESYFASRVDLDFGAPELLTPADISVRWRPLLSAFDPSVYPADISRSSPLLRRVGRR